MHIIREEIEAGLDEQDDDLAHTPAATESGTQPAVGGLSRALRPGFGAPSPWGARAQSLRNLLDQDLVEQAAARTPSLPPPSPAAAQHPPQQQPPPPLPQQQQREAGAKRPSLEEQRRGGGKMQQWDRKQEVIEGVNDLIDELKDIDNAIAQQAVEHIHANEVVLTFGYSRTVVHFLKRAREKRDFRVFVAEAAPTYQGLQMAAELADAGIETTVITDAEVYAMMARVNKVCVGGGRGDGGGGFLTLCRNIFVAAARRRSWAAGVPAGAPSCDDERLCCAAGAGDRARHTGQRWRHGAGGHAHRGDGGQAAQRALRHALRHVQAVPALPPRAGGVL